jgi:hypothetical protein
MKPLQLIPVGSTVKILPLANHDSNTKWEAIVRAILIDSDSVNYQVFWWANGHRHVEWVTEVELYQEDDESFDVEFP